MTTTALRMGNTLFRLRSFTPLPVAVVCLGLLTQSLGTVGAFGAVLEAAAAAVGLALCAAGQAVRFVTLGLVRDGTSGQDAALRAAALNTTGPYALVRNPLYLGNLLIVLGLLLIAGDARVLALGLGFFALEYGFIVAAEEAFLADRFGAAYAHYRREVPRWLPLGPTRWAPTGTAFDWRRALKKEINPVGAWGLVAVGLSAMDLWAAGAWTTQRGWWLGAAAAGLVVSLLSVKAWKKGWWPGER